MEGPYNNPDEVYRSRCGKWFSQWAVTLFHEMTCHECQLLKHGERENDADDRGICYEDD